MDFQQKHGPSKLGPCLDYTINIVWYFINGRLRVCTLQLHLLHRKPKW